MVETPEVKLPSVRHVCSESQHNDEALNRGKANFALCFSLFMNRELSLSLELRCLRIL